MALTLERLIKISEHVYILSMPTNVGIITIPTLDNSLDIYLIESGNDDDTAQIISDFLKKTFNNFNLKAIINTHSHADHCGGNSYFVEHYNCQLWATKGEAALMEFPELETSLIWGGTPINEMRSKFLLAKPCTVNKRFSNEETIVLPTDNSNKQIKLKVISLPGHYLDQAGYLIEDTDNKSSLFLGDAISGRNIIKKYWIQYLFDEEKMKQSLLKISKIKADYYIPGHGNFVTEIEGLAELNILALLETENMILDELKVPKTTEEILKSVADRNNISLKTSQYFLIGSTLRSYISALHNANKIKLEIKDNKMLWQKV